MIKPLANTKGHLKYLDSLRACAALYVMLHHAAINHQSYVKYKGVQKLILSAFSYGHYAVAFFIVLSGFSLMLPVIRNNYNPEQVLDFYKRRAIRILPPYFIALLISYLLILTVIGNPTETLWRVSIPVNAKDIVTHLLLIHDNFTDTIYKINGVLWSVSVEYRIYFFFPALLFIRTKKGIGTMLLFTIIVSALITATLYFLQSKIDFLNIYGPGVSPYLVLFTLGIIAAELSYGKLMSQAKRLNTGMMTLVSIVIFIGIGKIPVIAKSEYHYFFLDAVFGIVSGLILVYYSQLSSANTHSTLNKIVSWQPLVRLGGFSYSLYLIHLPLQQVIWQYLIIRYTHNTFYEDVMLMLLSVVLIIPIAYLFFKLFERPFIALGKRRQSVKADSVQLHN